MASVARPAPPPVVACIDGSGHSPSVCEYAAWLAGPRGASVEVVHLDDRFTGSGAPPGAPSQLEGYIRAEGEQLMHDAAEWVVESGGDLGDLMVGVGPLVEVAGRLSEAAGVLVLGQRGRSSPGHSLRLGANVLRILGRAAAPICLTPVRSRPVSRVLALFNAAFPDEALTRFVGVDPALDGLECRVVGYGNVRPPRPKWSASPAAAIEACLEEADFDLLVLPRSALVAHPQRRDLEGLITILERPVMLPAQGGLARTLFEARAAAASDARVRSPGRP